MDLINFEGGEEMLIEKMKNKFYILSYYIFLVFLFFFLSCAEEKILKAGDRAPDFLLKDLVDKEHRLSDYRGKVVFLNFFACWCPFCIEEISELNKLYEEFSKNKEFVLLGINLNESKTKVGQFVKNKDIKYPILLDNEGKVAKVYQVVGIPLNIVVDKNGIIKFLDHNLPEKKLIESLLKEK